MTDAPESPLESTVLAASPHGDRPNRLNQVAAWVGIVAGIVFIVAAVFFTGVYAGQTYGHRDRDWRATNGSCPMMSGGMMGSGGGMPGGMMSPGGMSPGMMPGMPGGKMGPGQQAPTPPTARPSS